LQRPPSLPANRSWLKTGLYLVQPYQEGKITVVFVHGTASSPATWAKMFNGLQGNHEIRKRLQFWFFIYTTGNPVDYSASLLRDSLREAISSFDPEDSDSALKQTVVIGHSQGDLLTKMMVARSNDKFWRNISHKNFDEMSFTEKQSAILRRSFFFEPLPFIRRVIFISTPQRGSFITGDWIGKLNSILVTMPINIIKLGTGIF
jgi:pimeloyl-ACP methyl ester carboxylesterase